MAGREVPTEHLRLPTHLVQRGSTRRVG